MTVFSHPSVRKHGVCPVTAAPDVAVRPTPACRAASARWPLGSRANRYGAGVPGLRASRFDTVPRRNSVFSEGAAGRGDDALCGSCAVLAARRAGEAPRRVSITSAYRG